MHYTQDLLSISSDFTPNRLNSSGIKHQLNYKSSMTTTGSLARGTKEALLYAINLMSSSSTQAKRGGKAQVRLHWAHQSGKALVLASRGTMYKRKNLAELFHAQLNNTYLENIDTCTENKLFICSSPAVISVILQRFLSIHQFWWKYLLILFISFGF